MIEYVTTHGVPFLSHWDINGATRENTDNGRCWLEVNAAPALTLYRDPARQLAVATATLEPPGAELTPVNDSGLSGTLRVTQAHAALGVIDIFYAADDDLLARQAGIAQFLEDGAFAGREGFSEPCLRAKRVIDALLSARLGPGVILDELAPLCEPAACYALQFMFDYLSARADDAAAQLSLRWRNAAREALVRVRVKAGDIEIKPFEPRLLRA